MKEREKRKKKEKIKIAKEKEKQRQIKLKEVEQQMQLKQGEFTQMGKNKKEKVDASTQIIIVLYLGCIIMVGIIFAMIKFLK